MAIDPVRQPSAYQRMLLDLLGPDDPAAVQAETPPLLRALVEEAGERVRERPEPAEWSVQDCIAHIVDAELVVGARYRWIVAHDEPQIVPYDQDLWVDRVHRPDEDVEEQLTLFDVLRRVNLAMWARSTPEERARIGHHAERGPESYDLTFRLLAGHDRFHIAQARRALDAVRGRASASAGRGT